MNTNMIENNSIQAKHLKLSYGARTIVPDVDLSIDKPEIISIIGPNGSGKSTILKGLARILKPAGGSVILDGKDIQKMPTKEVAKKLAVLPQTLLSPGDMTVEDLIACGRSPHRGIFSKLNDYDKFHINEAIKLTSLEKFAHRRIDTLSGGERQRAWLAMALAQKPKILMLDEPTSFLDIRYQLELMNLVQHLHAKINITVIMVLHDLNHAARYSDRIIAVKNGAIYADGKVPEVFTAETLKYLYEVEATVMNIEQEGGRHLVFFPHDICQTGKVG
ncbi:ABC transporter ATP-binding protein [Selenomonadales bacterium OttesenSCG-928-I06]|nr:ABC transporter ATP-binding protein [Selenomonadales bacterium OttesenSCG-928-I06]